jgi:hypothetical protein
MFAETLPGDTYPRLETTAVRTEVDIHMVTLMKRQLRQP